VDESASRWRELFSHHLGGIRYMLAGMSGALSEKADLPDTIL
jgi:hypothetical protein